jgi:DUF4097 and DUF4098 domain-containing protein YvlB
MCDTLSLHDALPIFYPVKGNDFQINLTGSYAKNELPDPVNLSVERTRESVKVRIIQNNKIFFILINKDLHLNIGVPENYPGDVILSDVSGEVEAKNLNLNNFEAKTVSSGINIMNLTSKSEVTINSVSGDIILKNIKAGNIKVGSVSGEVGISSSENISSVKTTSGEIKIEDYLVENDLNLESVSGGVHLELLPESSINLKFDSVSGDLKNDFGEVSGGKNNIYVKTTSGDLIISGKNN